MTTTVQIRDDNTKFDLVISDNMPEIFTDGVAQLLMGYPISKLTFHSVVTSPDSSSQIEQRKGILSLAMSTPVLLELCRNVLIAAQSSLDELSEGGTKIDSQIRKIMEGVAFTALPSKVIKKKK